MPSPTLQNQISAGPESPLCFRHEEAWGTYYCHACQSWRCRNCVKLFEKVALCPDCDALCVAADTFTEQAQKTARANLPFEAALTYALAFPLRRPLATLWVWLIGWFIACSVETLSDIAGGPRIEQIIFGSLDRIGILGLGLSTMFVSWMGFSYLRVRADGKEASRFSELTAFDEMLEPLALWGLAFLIGVGPLLIHVGVPLGQKTFAFVFGDVDPAKYPKPGWTYYLGVCFWSGWALVVYPLELLVAGLKRTFLDMFNPTILAGAWVSLKPWLIPAAKRVVPAYAMVIVTGGVLYHRPLGTAVTLFVFSVASLIAGIVLGTALDYAYDTLDLEMTPPPPKRLAQKLAEERDSLR